MSRRRQFQESDNIKAVVIGAGRIGCGFAGQLLRDSGYEVVFIARNPHLVEYLNRVGRYCVRSVDGAETVDTVVDGVRAISTAEPQRVAAEIREAELIITAVGANNLPAVAPFIAAGLSQREASANVLAFENLANAGPYLCSLVADHLSSSSLLARHGFSGALVDRIVTQRSAIPAGDELLIFTGEPAGAVVVDGQSLHQPLPAIEGMIVADDYTAWIRRKLYTFSAGHAACAYLGYLKGYHYIHAAIRDPEIQTTVLNAMAEGQRGLAACYGPEIAGDEDDLYGIVARFENAALNDPVTRVARDPKRKLGAEDRLVGAARLAEETGVRPANLALAIAAALCYHDSADPLVVELQREIQTAGADSILCKVSSLETKQGLGRAVIQIWRRLAQGWREGNLLLSLEQWLWTWEP